jgi:FlaG/FlaF family flagellin (archaellin)
LILGGIGVMIAAQLIGLSYGSLPHYGRYVTSVVLMYAIGYPIGHTAVLGAFSKIQKSGPQAAMMGWFATSGSFARILLPIVSGYLDKALDNSPFNIVLFMLTLSYLSVVMLKPQLRKHIEIKDSCKTTETQVTTEPQPVEEKVNVTGKEGKIRIVDTFWSIVTDVEKAWVSLSRVEKVEVTLMAFLMIFSLFELLILSGKFNSVHGYNIGEDLSPDMD